MESRRFVAPIVLGLVVVVIAGWVTVASVLSRDPEETVEAYLSAIVDKDVDAALALVSQSGYGVPYGDRAVFLTPEAISDDWWVVSVTEIGRDYSTSAQVKAVIAGPGGTAEGEFDVDEYDDEWLLTDPFARVMFPSSPLSYFQANGKIVPRPTDLNGYETYSLFPGTYRFFQSVPDVVDAPETEVVAVFPVEDDERSVVPPALTIGKDTVAQLQKAVRQRIDECTGFATATPYGDCPFATDGEIDTPNGKRVTDLHGLTWKVTAYPVATLTDDRADAQSPGFTLQADEPGAVTLTGSGIDTDGNPTTFTVTCDVDLTGMRANIGADGAVTLSVSPAASYEDGFNTCRRNA